MLEKIAVITEGDQAVLLSDIRRGVEKEHLRVSPDGQLSHSPHPKLLGAALTNPWVTTDFSEALLEIITPPENNLDLTYSQVKNLTQFISQGIGDELLWPSSMPCALDDARNVPLADYGKNNVGRMKKIYRRGLCHRYGRAMQVMAGIHYNFSLPEKLFKRLHAHDHSSQKLTDYISASYMGLVRNFFRYAWVLPYLFGASPACAKSSVIQKVDFLKKGEGDTFYGEYATSLRLGDLGYQNKGQNLLNITYNHADDYAKSLLKATQTPYKPFSDIGLCDGDDYKQLNDALLQIENEYYSPIRPKQIAKSCERPSEALMRRGVAYVEARILDLNPLEPYSIDEDQMRFMDVFLLYCLLQDSPEMSQAELDCCKDNIKKVASFGRDPGLTLSSFGAALSSSSGAASPSSSGLTRGSRKFKNQAMALLEDLSLIAELFNKAKNTSDYSKSLHQQIAKLNDVNLTPSAIILNEMQSEQLSFQDYHLQKAKDYHLMLNEVGDPKWQKQFQQAATESIAEFKKIESQPQKPFQQFLKEYFSDNT